MSRKEKEQPLTRDSLVGMEVIDSSGHAVGRVLDVALAVGQTGISLSVDTPEGEPRAFPWDMVQAAGDFVLLKEDNHESSLQQTSSNKQGRICSICGEELTYIQQYQRWYCYKDRVYAWSIPETAVERNNELP
jgi:sporulation protein YlmC with PRC-barrel domain